jgi:hypothetical protein
MSKKLGIIQSRGLGDLVIALPIARYYYEQGQEIIWPICEEFIQHMQPVAPWVKWVPVKTDHGPFFYDVPLQRLKNFKCDEIICLYQALTGHKFHEEKYFQYTSFDQYKYIVAGVPFLEKWNLAQCITRNPEREQALYDHVVTNENYVVVHLQGSDHRATYDASIIPPGWQIIEINEQTDCIWDWLKVLEGAQSLILVDSVFANIVDQLGIGDDRYFIQRSHIGLTPVQGQHWHWL